MNFPWTDVAWWSARILLGGGVILLLGWTLTCAVRQPVRKQRIAEWSILAVLCLAVLAIAPNWLAISYPEPVEVAEKTTPDVETPSVPAAPFALSPIDEEPVFDEPEIPVEEPPLAESLARPRFDELDGDEATPTVQLLDWLVPLLVSLYALGACYFLVRLVLGYAQLGRFLASAWEAPAHLKRTLAQLNPQIRGFRLLVSPRLRTPLSCGLWRPTIVLPECLAESGDTTQIRWALAHELSHLSRRDAWTTFWFGLARALYYPLPWFWSLRRQVRLSQEYVADAAAVAAAGPVEDYAGFLLRWSTTPAAPVGASGVAGHTSDLLRRITMLVRSPLAVEQRCPRRWSFAAALALLSLAVLAAGIGLSKAAASPEDAKKPTDPTKKEEPKKEEPKKEDKKPERNVDPLDPFGNLEELLKRLPGGFDEDLMKQLQEQREMTRRMLEQLRKQVPGGGIGPLPGGGIMPLPLPFPDLQRLNRGLNLNRRQDLSGKMTEPRLGARLEKPSMTLVDQLDLPKDQGLILDDIAMDSAAAKAGMKQHDILMELNGKPVPSDGAQFAKLLQDIKADEAIEAVVLRKSRKETIKGLKLPEASTLPKKPGKQPFRLDVPFGDINVELRMARDKDGVTIRKKIGDIAYTVKSKKDGSAPEITIQQGEKSNTYIGIDKVPEEYRDKVKELLKNSGGSQFKDTPKKIRL